MRDEGGASPVPDPLLSLDDAHLARRILGGEDEAIAEVRRWVRGAASPYRHLLADELEDIEQETLVELTESLRAERFRGESRLATYVKRSVHFRAIDRIRARRRRVWVDIADLELPSPAEGPFEAVAASVSRAVALRIAARMPEECRRLWRMILEGLGYEEMSRRLDIAAGTLRVRVLRCRRRAAAELERSP